MLVNASATSTSATFAVAANDAAELMKPLTGLARAVARPSAGFVFLAGEIARDASLVARAVGQAWPGVPTVIATGAGVMNERAAFEGQSSAAAVLVSGVRAAPFVVPSSADALGPALTRAVGQATEGRAATAVLFVTPDPWSPDALDDLAPNVHVVGGGTLPERSPIVVEASGAISSGMVAGLALFGAPAVIGVSSACRPLADGPRSITEAHGAVVLSLGGEPALDVLSRAAQGLEGRPLVLALHPSREDPSGRRGAKVRPIRGVDPTRKAVVLGEAVRVGERMGFAVLDGSAARADLEVTLREASRRAAGAAARFALYVGCAGRGSALYGTSGVDARLVRAQFPSLPFAGVMSSFELAPAGGRPAMHLYTGVLGLFTVLS